MQEQLNTPTTLPATEAAPTPEQTPQGAAPEAPPQEAPPQEAAAPAQQPAAEPPAGTDAEPRQELTPAQTAAALAERFPALFALQQPLPLKLRIQADIQQRAPGVFTRKALSVYLHRYTTGTPYLKSLVQHTQRFDLDGQAAGEIAAEHRSAAEAEVARRRALVQERRAAERKPDRNAQRKPERAARGQGAGPRHEAPRERRPQQRERPPRPERPQRPAGMPQASQLQREPAPEAAQQAPALPPAELAARRERALLLRAFETSPLSKANFCALKGLAEAALDAQLAQARAEALATGGRAQARPASRP